MNESVNDFHEITKAMVQLTAEIKSLGEKIVSHYDLNKDDHKEIWEEYKGLVGELKVAKTDIAILVEEKNKLFGAISIIKIVSGTSITVVISICGVLYTNLDTLKQYIVKDEQRYVDDARNILKLQEAIGVLSSHK
jgi:hypothetical protein